MSEIYTSQATVQDELGSGFSRYSSGENKFVNYDEHELNNNFSITSESLFNSLETISFASSEANSFTSSGSIVNATQALFKVSQIRFTKIVCNDQQEKKGDEMYLKVKQTFGQDTIDWEIDASIEHMWKGQVSSFAQEPTLLVGDGITFTLWDDDDFLNGDDQIGNSKTISSAGIWKPGENMLAFKGDGAQYDVYFVAS